MQPGSDDRPNASMQHAYKRQGKRACGESEKTQVGIKENLIGLATKDINIPCMHAEVRRLVCMALH